MTIQAFQTGHIGLNISNLERSREFYQAVFGFEIMGGSEEKGHRYVFLGNGGKLVLTLWEQSEGRFANHQPGLHHLSFQVEAIEQVAEAEEKIRALGAKLFYDGIVSHREGASSGGIFFEDPDGIRLEIFAPVEAGTYATLASGAPACGFF
jgi:catechol-2,3-dioxygenase